MSQPITGNAFANLTNALSLPSGSIAIADISQTGNNILVRLSVSIVFNTGTNGQPCMQVLTPSDERIPVPLGRLRSLSDVRRCLQLLLQNTMASHGINPAQMTRCAAIVPASRQPINNGLIGVTDDETIWRTYTNTIESMYHPPCNSPETCQICREPAVVVACFPAATFRQDLGMNVTILDGYNQQHGEDLERLSRIEQQRYIRIVQPQVTAHSAPNAIVQTGNSTGPSSQSTQSSLTSTDSITGPKGRRLVSGKAPDKRPKDYSKGTLRPTTAEQGTKANTDTCLTCINYGHKCTGTTMKLVPSSRIGRSAQWKCDQCRNPQRRCLWRSSMDVVTSYDTAFKADGGKNIEKNTVEGRKKRAEERNAAIKANQDEIDEEDEQEHEDEEDEDATVEEDRQ